MAPEKDGVEKTFSWEGLSNENENLNENIPDIDAIIHLAGKAHDTKNQSAADVYFKVNTGLTQKIFDWYLEHPPRPDERCGSRGRLAPPAHEQFTNAEVD